MTFTPGQWQVEKHIIGGEEMVFVTQGRDGDSPVSLLRMNGPCAMYSNAANDAALIAAAPDMLAILKRIADEGYASDSDCRAAEAAIAKAEGR